MSVQPQKEVEAAKDRLIDLLLEAESAARDQQRPFLAYLIGMAVHEAIVSSTDPDRSFEANPRQTPPKA